MNLVIDCFKLVKGEGKSIGIPHLTRSIVVNLGRRVLEQEQSGQKSGKSRTEGAPAIIVLGNAWNREEFDVPGVIFVEVEGDPRNKLFCVYWELVLVGKYARQYAADRILFPRGYRPLSPVLGIGRHRIKDTILIHDLIPFYYHTHHPGVFHPLENAYIMRRLKDSIRGADRVITISDYSRRDILEKVPGSGRKIKVIYNGVNEITLPEAADRERPEQKEAEAADREKPEQKEAETADRERSEQKETEAADREKPEQKEAEAAGRHPDRKSSKTGKQADAWTPGSYMVAMTSGLPHKNARGILRAYEAYRKRTTSPLPLTVIGIGDTSAYPEMNKEAAAAVRCLSYIGDFKEMCRIAGGARVYLFLSYVEGFGFPPLEAMQLGVPVVCSDRSSLPEVVGEAGILVDPDDPERAADGLLQAAEDEELRQSLIRKGYENIKRFSWETRTGLYWKELFR